MSVSSTEFMDVALFQNRFNLPCKTKQSDNRVFMQIEGCQTIALHAMQFVWKSD